MKRILIVVAALTLVGGIGLAAVLWPAYTKAKHSSDVWNSLSHAVKENEWNEVKELLSDTGRDLHEIKENKIIYFGTLDYTDQIAGQKVNFRDTILYYFNDPRSKERDKVVFGGGYALIENNIVTFIKYY